MLFNPFAAVDFSQMPPKVRAELQRIMASGDPLPAPEPVEPECAVCGDLGLVRFVVPVDDPRFGKLQVCPERCAKVLAMEEDRRQASLRAMLQWSDYDAQGYKDFDFVSFAAACEAEYAAKRGQYSAAGIQSALHGKRGALAAAQAFGSADFHGQLFTLTDAAKLAFGENATYPNDDAHLSNCVYLYGDYGTGKTSLAVAAFNATVRRGESAVFVRLLSLINRVQRTYGREKADVDDGKLAIIHKLVAVDKLFLDEVGIANVTADRIEIVESIVRQRDVAGRPTFYTSNTPPEKLDSLWGVESGRLIDIILKAHPVAIGGVKLRQVATKKGGGAW